MMLNSHKALKLTAIGAVTLSALVVTPAAQGATRVSNHSSTSRAALRTHASSAFSYRLEDQLLATLRYLPVEFKLAVTRTSPTTTTVRSPKPAALNMTTIEKGTFVWRFKSLPAAL